MESGWMRESVGRIVRIAKKIRRIAETGEIEREYNKTVSLN
jgi:hypothetical protein